MVDEAVNDGSDGRAEGGQFARGNKLARGNPNNRRMGELRKVLLDAVEPRHVEGVYRVMLRAALEGDIAAARVVLDYAVGKPMQAVEVSGPDGGPLGGDLGQLQAVILAALARFPEARFAVAAELRAVRDAGPPEDPRCSTP